MDGKDERREANCSCHPQLPCPADREAGLSDEGCAGRSRLKKEDLRRQRNPDKTRKCGGGEHKKKRLRGSKGTHARDAHGSR